MNKQEKLKHLQARLSAAKTLEEKLAIKDEIQEIEGKEQGDYQQPECVGCGA